MGSEEDVHVKLKSGSKFLREESGVREVERVLIDGQWRERQGGATFETYSPIEQGWAIGRFPISTWADIDQCLEAGASAYRQLRVADPTRIATFLERYADAIDARRQELADIAHLETALPVSPRLRDVEIPRTVDQLRQASTAVRSRSWREPRLDTGSNIHSILAPIPGCVVVMGPNNFPFAFNSVAGGDFAAAVATGHPVIAKANPGHPQSTKMLAECAMDALEGVDLPPSLIQLIYRTAHEDGERMVSDRRVAATAYTGSRSAGLALKAAADRAGRPIYLEMSSVNPVVVLRGAIRERGNEVANDIGESILLGAGQFCTSPGLVFVEDERDASGDDFVQSLGRVIASKVGRLVGDSVRVGLEAAREAWLRAGAEIVDQSREPTGYCRFPSTLMEVPADVFLEHSDELQTEAFGSMALAVRAESREMLIAAVSRLEGNLTGTIYSGQGEDCEEPATYGDIATILRERVGRLLNDKVPTGVAVVGTMNHGGPYPSTGHPGFSAVGIPVSLRRFTMLQCFDGVRQERLPLELQEHNPLGVWRNVDGEWTR